MTTQPTPCNVRGRAMPPPLRSISSRMLGIISSSSAALRSEEEETTSDKNTTRASGTATASEICNRALHVSAQQEEQQHQSRRSSHRRASSFLSTRSSQGEERRRSSLYSVGSNILSDLSSVADEMMSSLALEAADTTSEVDQPTPTRPSRRRSSHRALLNAPNDTGKHDGQSPIPTTSRPKRHRASFHYPGVSSRPTSNRHSSCSSMLSIDSEQSEIHHSHQVYLQTTRRRRSSLYDIDDEHEDNVGDGDDDDMLDEEVGNASDVENMAIHRPGTSLAGNDAQESVRDLTFFRGWSI